MRRALAIDEKSFGPDHPEVAKASTTWPVAAGHQPAGGGEPLMRRALAIDEARLWAGPCRRRQGPQQPGALAGGHERLGGGRAVDAAGAANFAEVYP